MKEIGVRERSMLITVAQRIVCSQMLARSKSPHLQRQPPS